MLVVKSVEEGFDYVFDMSDLVECLVWCCWLGLLMMVLDDGYFDSVLGWFLE